MSHLFRLEQIAEVTGGQVLHGDPLTPVSGFAYDSRQVNPGDCFVAMPGERVDGHHFVDRAFAAGAVAAIVGREVAAREGALLRVNDPLFALGLLGAHHRRRFHLPVVAVTGSVGKTTTKEMIAAALSARLCVFRSSGNLNSEVGLPITLMALDEMHQAAVLEMGMRALGEIAYLASIAQHEIGVVTNVGASHLESLGSRANIARAKAELIETLPPGGIAVLNADDDLVAEMAALAPGALWRYGFHATGERAITVRDLRSEGEAGQRFLLVTPDGEGEAFLPAPGRHNVLNAMAATAVGLQLGLTLPEVIRGLAGYEPAGNRMRIFTVGSVRVIDDTYNAAPDSVLAALQVMRDVAGGGRCLAVLGSMFELGALAVESHRQVGEAAGRLADAVFAVGDLAATIADAARSGGAQAAHFPAKESAVTALQGAIRPGDTILVKGSRGMAMEEIVAFLEGHLSRFAQ